MKRAIKTEKQRDIAVVLLKRVDRALFWGDGIQYVCVLLSNLAKTKTESHVAGKIRREIQLRISPLNTVTGWLNRIHGVSWSKMSDENTLLYRKRWVKSMITELNSLTF